MSIGIENNKQEYKNNLFNKKVKVSIHTAGYCKQLEKITIGDGKGRTIHFPAHFFCIEHPQLGPILFDTGYTDRFFPATARFPFLLYRWITPVHVAENETAIRQLQLAGVHAKDISYIILSHFHADHISGLNDFPYAKFIYLQAAYDDVKHRKGWSALLAGFLPDLLPPDFEQRSLPLDESKLVSLPPSFPFKRGLDIFGDGSIIAVDLPGHAAGQIGILFDTKQQPYFLCADAVWSSRAFREGVKPHWIANLMMNHPQQYKESFQNVQQFHKNHPEYRIIPSHCSEYGKDDFRK